MTVIGQLF